MNPMDAPPRVLFGDGWLPTRPVWINVFVSLRRDDGSVVIYGKPHSSREGAGAAPKIHRPIYRIKVTPRVPR